MNRTAPKRPAVPPPSKLRAAADSLLPVSGVPQEDREEPEKPVRSRLLAVAENVDFAAPDNLTTSTDQTKYKDLNFKVSELYHRRVKAVATNWGMSMKELFEAAFENWVDRNGERPKSVEEYKRAKEERKRNRRSDD